MQKKDELYIETLKQLEDIGVTPKKIALIVYELQKEYNDKITLEECEENVLKVMEKREVIHTVLTGLAIDKLAQENKFPEPIQSIIKRDDGLYGVDEILPLGIVNLYGTIGLTNFGYLDKKKIGIIDEIDKRKKEHYHVDTFADDIIAAIAAAAASRIAHGDRKEQEDDEKR